MCEKPSGIENANNNDGEVGSVLPNAVLRVLTVCPLPGESRLLGGGCNRSVVMFCCIIIKLVLGVLNKKAEGYKLDLVIYGERLTDRANTKGGSREGRRVAQGKKH